MFTNWGVSTFPVLDDVAHALLDWRLFYKKSVAGWKIVKLGITLPNLFRVDPFRVTGKAAHIHSGLKRTPATQRVGLVARLTAIYSLKHVAITLIIVQRRDRSIDWNLVKVRTTQTNQLRRDENSRPASVGLVKSDAWQWAT
jgi:hypothetical protein